MEERSHAYPSNEDCKETRQKLKFFFQNTYVDHYTASGVRKTFPVCITKCFF